MSTKQDLLNTRIQHPPERLTLFSICCPCLMPKKLECRPSDIALVICGKDEPHEYVVEKLIIKKVPLKLFGVEKDFNEYENELRKSFKSTDEKEIAVAMVDTKKTQKLKEEMCQVSNEQLDKKQEPIKKRIHTKSSELTNKVSESSLQVNYNTPLDDLPNSRFTFPYESMANAKSGEELILRTITADTDNTIVTETDQRIAKMSPDLERTIITLKAAKPRPNSTQGTPLPIKNQKKRLCTRNIELEGLLTKGGYDYAPCVKDSPLQGIQYTLNKNTFTPAIEEVSKSVITELNAETIGDHGSETKISTMADEATTNYEDATVVARPDDDMSTICEAMANFPSMVTLSDDKGHFLSEYSSDSTNCLGAYGSRRFRNFFQPPYRHSADFGTTDFSVYNAETRHRASRRFGPPRYKKKNLKWKIVINDNNRGLATTSSSDFQLQFTRQNSREKNFWGSGISY